MSGENALSSETVVEQVDADPYGSGGVEIRSEQLLAQALSVGEQLRATRESKGLTIAEVAKSLKWGPRQVEALEADDWPSLPCKTIIRGFVRNYARLLNLEPDPLMRSLEQMNLPQAPELEMVTGVPVKISEESQVDRRNYVRVFSGLFILILAVMVSFFFPKDVWQSTLSALKAATKFNGATVEQPVAPTTLVEAKTAEIAVVPATATVLPALPVVPLPTLPIPAELPDRKSVV